MLLDESRHLYVVQLHTLNVVKVLFSHIVDDPLSPIHSTHSVLNKKWIIGWSHTEDVYLKAIFVKETKHILRQIENRFGIKSASNKTHPDLGSRVLKFLNVAL